MSEQAPRVSIGIPVYNSEETIARGIESVLAQTFGDFEVVVADNRSTDHTGEICRSIAARDPRVRYVLNETNIGQNNNFNRVVELSRGEFFRWMGDDDWLEPGYLAACVAALDANEEAVVVTTYQRHVEGDGSFHYEEYRGPRPTDPSPIRRLDQMLRLLSGSPFWIDPVYSMARREVIAETALMRPKSRFADLAFSCELAMAGPWVHVPEFLCSRNYEPLPRGWRAFAQYTGLSTSNPVGWLVARSQRVLFLWTMAKLVATRPGLSFADRVRGWSSIVAYYARVRGRQVRRRIGRVAAQLSG